MTCFIITHIKCWVTFVCHLFIGLVFLIWLHFTCASALAWPDDSTAAASACNSNNLVLAFSFSLSLSSFCLSKRPVASCSLRLASWAAVLSTDLQSTALTVDYVCWTNPERENWHALVNIRYQGKISIKVIDYQVFPSLLLPMQLKMLELKGGQVTLGANWEKHYVLVYTLHTHAVSFKCRLHMLWTSVYCETYTDGRNWSPVAEPDTNLIFKILWLNPLLVLGS